ncbi:MAG: LysM peptidoglycan-binding domain-containing protein [Treponema sp.]|nr:LysM peptidoglycan-binding domain-containing protein [Treponema sp.]
MKTIGIKLADGSFYPVLEDNSNQEKTLDLTTANNNQTTVMVDLYRSALCSMEDAEYVDTLQIDNLVEHPIGEPDITFTISIDENKQLSAKIVDKETGSQSKTSITLVSRTEEQRLSTDDYSVSDSQIHSVSELYDDSKKSTKVAIAGGGLLATAAALASNSEDDKTTVTFDSAENTIVADTTEISEDEDFPEYPEDEIFDSDLTNLDGSNEEFTENSEKIDVSYDENDNTIIENTNLQEQDEEDFASDIPIVDNTILEDSFDEQTSIETTDLSSDNSEFDSAFDSEENSDDTIVATSLDSNDENEFNTFTEPSSDPSSLDFSIFEDDNSQSIESEISEPSENFEIEENNTETTLESTETTDFTESVEPDFDINFDENDTSDNIPVGGGISFTGLYDKETELGESASSEEQEVKKRTKKPVIICIICAIICIIATILVLFFVPGIFKTDKEPTSEISETTIEQIIPEQVVEEPEEVIPEAKEDEIIVVEKAEEVVPEQPPVVEEEQAPKVITYKIKWGDTLWDIADTYYKNPWKYKFIAKHNNIKNPDHIISGTFIEIPEE